jgi:hypothetical protein
VNDTLRSAAIAVLAIAAIALAAATLPSTVSPESGNPGPGDGPGEGGLLPVPGGQPAATPIDPLRIPYLSEILSVLAVVAAVVALAYVLTNWREALPILTATVAVVAVVLLLFWLFGSPNRPVPPGASVPNGSILGGGGGGQGGTGETSAPSIPSVLVLFVLGFALVGTVLTFFRTRSSTADESSPDAEGETTGAAAVGRAAGRAADRIEEETGPDNEVYRAWREMTGLLDVTRPETTTPGEFAAAAVDAGIARPDVSELTRLFEDVRYGGTEPSDADERRALAIFRHIEDEYAEDES